MITNYVVSSEILNNGCRLDSSFHLSSGNIARNCIANSPLSTKDISFYTKTIFYGNRAKRIYVNKKEFGVPFLSSSDILQADLDNVKCVSKKHTQNIEEQKLKYGWTLITRSGTVGKTTYCTHLHEGKLSSEHVIRVVPNEKIKSGCLYAYLSSSYGYALLTQGMFGAVIQSIEPSYIEGLPIPIFSMEFQNEVDELIQEYASLREEATCALHKAIKIFEEEIGTSNISLGFQTISVSSKEITSKFTRFDSQYQIGKSELNKKKQGLNCIKIGSVALKILVGNRGKREYVDKNGIPFLSSSEMMLANPLRQCKMIRKSSKNIENLLVSKGDILISRSGTVGNTVLVSNTLNGVAVSEHAMKLTVDSSQIAPEYVYAYLQTRQGQDSLHILPYGSVIVTLGEDFLADIDLPLIDKEKMEIIVSLIKEYCKKTDESIVKESTAISLVEQEIDKWNN